MQILVLDVETSGLDAAKDRVIEVAAAVYSLEHRAMVRARSWLIAGETNEAESVNGIPPALLSKGIDFDVVSRSIREIASRECQAIVAHSADFDRKWFSPDVQALPWVCSMRDLTWPRSATSKSLVALALAHGVGVSAAHRALDDVMTLVRVFERAQELGADVPAMIASALRPKVRVVSLAPFEDRERVKAAGFEWNAAKREWWRKMPAEDVAALPFAVRVESTGEAAA